MYRRGVVEGENSLADNNYFRLNIWGMNWMRGLLAGVLSEESAGDWPKLEMFGDDEDTRDAFFDWHYEIDGAADAPHDDERFREAAKVVHNHLAFRSEDAGKVPISKFGSNDGWIVTPEECTLLADALGPLARAHAVATGNEDEVRVIKKFEAFNRVCAQGSGYRVH